MRMNQTPAAERIHIGFFGRRNAGKSSVMNAVTGQNLAVVSNVKGTTTDPVYKAMELLPLGPVMMIDTPGIDDKGELGELRVRKSHQILNKTDLAVLVVDGTQGMKEEDYDMVKLFEKKTASARSAKMLMWMKKLSGRRLRFALPDNFKNNQDTIYSVWVFQRTDSGKTESV